MSGRLRISPGGPGVSMKNMLASISFDPYKRDNLNVTNNITPAPAPPPAPAFDNSGIMYGIAALWRSSNLGGQYAGPVITPTSDPYQMLEHNDGSWDGSWLHWIMSVTFVSVGDTKLILEAYAHDYTAEPETTTLMDRTWETLKDGEYKNVTLVGTHDVLPALVTGHAYLYYWEATMEGGTSVTIERMGRLWVRAPRPQL